MEYERIHKVQTGIISPSKLRMKLIGPHHQKKKDGSNSNSSRTSPSKLEDSEFEKNSLLAINDGDFDQEVSSLEVSSVKLSGNAMSDAGQGDKVSGLPKKLIPRENGDATRVKLQQFSKDDSGSLSSIHPMRTLDDENFDYDSTSSFEFHKGERTHNPLTISLSRPMPSKWNDAGKWIIRQNVQVNYAKKSQHQGNGGAVMNNMVRVAPESTSYDNNKLSVKRVDFCHTATASSQMGLEKFSFVPHGSSHPISGQASGTDPVIDLCQSKDLKKVDNKDSSCTKSSTEYKTGVPAIRSVSMRDMGTEMTPIPSQEPSGTATPVGSITPLRSPTSSVPSTPRRGALTPTPTEHTVNDALQQPIEKGKKELSEQELKLKTRREIVALGVHLGKMNIAAWASKDEKEKNMSTVETIHAEGLQRIESEKRAAAWEEVEKSKHTARFKREEIKIQAWESQQKAKLEEEMRRIEAKVDQIRTHSHVKVVKKIAMTRQRAEEKRAAAEARKKREAQRTAARAEYIRQTGRILSSSFICCGWT